MWNPGFSHTDSQPARIYGFHRRLCLWSVEYRGTIARPGLVLGMDRGGSCRGMAFKVHDDNIEDTVSYLFERELVTESYNPIMVSIHLQSGKVFNALTFVSKTKHPQYAQKMNIKEAVSVVRSAKGASGSNIVYVLNTVEHLNALGIRNTELHHIAAAL